VEDHQLLANLRRDFLCQQGFEVVCAGDGRQAKRLLKERTFDLVVTDSVLPQTSGWELAGLAKRQGLPVILSSGWPVRLSREQVAARGVDMLCPKPSSLNQLLLSVHAMLQKMGRPGTKGSVRKPRKKRDL